MECETKNWPTDHPLCTKYQKPQWVQHKFHKYFGFRIVWTGCTNQILGLNMVSLYGNKWLLGQNLYLLKLPQIFNLRIIQKAETRLKQHQLQTPLYTLFDRNRIRRLTDFTILLPASYWYSYILDDEILIIYETDNTYQFWLQWAQKIKHVLKGLNIGSTKKTSPWVF